MTAVAKAGDRFDGRNSGANANARQSERLANKRKKEEFRAWSSREGGKGERKGREEGAAGEHGG